jgi:hypothetical protein
MQNGRLTTDNGKPRLKSGFIDGRRLAAGFLSIALSKDWDGGEEKETVTRFAGWVGWQSPTGASCPWFFIFCRKSATLQ